MLHPSIIWHAVLSRAYHPYYIYTIAILPLYYYIIFYYLLSLFGLLACLHGGQLIFAHFLKLGLLLAQALLSCAQLCLVTVL